MRVISRGSRQSEWLKSGLRVAVQISTGNRPRCQMHWQRPRLSQGIYVKPLRHVDQRLPKQDTREGKDQKRTIRCGRDLCTGTSGGMPRDMACNRETIVTHRTNRSPGRAAVGAMNFRGMCDRDGLWLSLRLGGMSSVKIARDGDTSASRENHRLC